MTDIKARNAGPHSHLSLPFSWNVAAPQYLHVNITLTAWSRPSYPALQNVQRYQALSTGAEPVESQLQEMLVEYLNAEVSLQTVKDISQAVQVCGGPKLRLVLH